MMEKRERIKGGKKSGDVRGWRRLAGKENKGEACCLHVNYSHLGSLAIVAFANYLNIVTQSCGS